MYLGEIVRNILLSFIDSVPPILFHGRSTPILNKQYGFDSAYMSMIEVAISTQAVRTVLVDKLGFHPELISDDDCEVTRAVCEMVATRAAALSSCALAAVLIQTGRARLGGGMAEGEKPYRVGLDGR
jgi:hexokinase